MSSGVVSKRSPAIAPRRPGRQPGARSPARCGTKVSPWPAAGRSATPCASGRRSVDSSHRCRFAPGGERAADERPARVDAVAEEARAAADPRLGDDPDGRGRAHVQRGARRRRAARAEVRASAVAERGIPRVDRVVRDRGQLRRARRRAASSSSASQPASVHRPVPDAIERLLRSSPVTSSSSQSANETKRRAARKAAGSSPGEPGELGRPEARVQRRARSAATRRPHRVAPRAARAYGADRTSRQVMSGVEGGCARRGRAASARSTRRRPRRRRPARLRASSLRPRASRRAAAPGRAPRPAGARSAPRSQPGIAVAVSSKRSARVDELPTSRARTRVTTPLPYERWPS